MFRNNQTHNTLHSNHLIHNIFYSIYNTYRKSRAETLSTRTTTATQDSPMATLDTRLPYRIGSRILPVLPVDTVPIPDLTAKFPNFSSHQTAIKLILGQYNIRHHGLHIAYRLHADTRPSDKYITIVIVACFQRGCNEAWAATVRKISSYLSHIGLDYAVELIDYALFGQRTTWPFLDDTYNWNQTLLSRIVSLVDQRQWVSIALVYLEDIEGREDSANFPFRGKSPRVRPTILFGAQDADQSYWWDNSILAFLQSIGFGEISVEITYLDQFGLRSTAPDIALLSSAYKYPTPMGSSCGSSASDRSGTLGGRIQLEKESKVIDLGLTNRHVLLNDSMEDEAAPASPKCQSGIVVQTPSTSDHAVRLENVEDAIEEDELDVSEYLGPRERYVDRALAAAKEEKEHLIQFNRKLGTVFAASNNPATAHTMSTEIGSADWALDWALVQLDPGKSIRNMVKGPLKTKFTVSNYCGIHHNRGYRVFKRGRTSGFTGGYISATEAIFRQRIPEPEDGPTIFAVELKRMWSKPMRCHTMVPDYRKRAVEFIQPGDSGSLILLDPTDYRLPQGDTNMTFKDDRAPGDPGINEWTPPWMAESGGSTDQKLEASASDSKEAYIAGLAFASNDYFLLSYMMPMDVVVKDIEAVTGGKVTMPANKGVVG
ncbi:hypothetical protein BDV95DRAFT_593597 [Massariosphaeria phaeospora]|uniref:Uncharacterized protein n=1 Tax=Massariosphaeria phaeospora TaxID=100035 RepID=A0A7C8M811_9PLEO|nr:hypothetical protein BDV95DRAFT_593597 [Massariosphaeria phaeospora]